MPHPLDILEAEAAKLTDAVADLDETAWNLPTRCTPWRARDLLGHVRTVLAWLPAMLAAPSPDHALVSARDYYRRDGRFDAETNAARVTLAVEAAARLDGPALVADFTATWREAVALCRAEPDGRVVRTRHGDAMLLTDFLLTRVVEVAVHGLDLADALGRPSWLTDAAASAVTGLLLDPTPFDRLAALGWDRETFVRKATSRAALSEAEGGLVGGVGVRWVVLG
ncbi:maleylpyruvate isomerase N-terminal domain-containing protein [Actinocorallia sp. A-T 12471]|uniref:maleylpyruvate isomerase N-terminal domain-containing protein n=1 Tax=Actinocorallia sp. A-T 12471 TaxID=3089813 RepID=UPI0029CB42C2|nr:maleylpyruvate isomerase N-terminal domain-containing protein [Actinocorallia sp. A-T 12471]MDX6744855.1 maleylpyruvate isomerase N-terminal domain-containing protein [Actinocorallia sp. A-T 12471]